MQVVTSVCVKPTSCHRKADVIFINDVLAEATLSKYMVLLFMEGNVFHSVQLC